MQFMMIMKATKDSEAGLPPSPALMEAVGKVVEENSRNGSLILGGGLLPSSNGVRIAAANGKLRVIDGPFAETKELIAGYAIMQFDSKELAIESARQMMQIHLDVLGSDYIGECEVRQIFGPEDFTPPQG